MEKERKYGIRPDGNIKMGEDFAFAPPEGYSLGGAKKQQKKKTTTKTPDAEKLGTPQPQNEPNEEESSAAICLFKESNSHQSPSLQAIRLTLVHSTSHLMQYQPEPKKTLITHPITQTLNI